MIIVTPILPTIDYDNLITTGGLIIIGAIAAFSSVQVALINVGRKHLRAIREQTENAHKDSPTPNLRENIDVNQYALVEMLRELTKDIFYIKRTINKNSRDIAKIKQEMSKNV
jgi:hypothetical protein